MERFLTVREALNEAMDEELARDESVFLMGEEVGSYNGAYKVSKGLLEKWGEKRIIDTPIAEMGFSGLGIGSAMTGLRPIIEFMSFNFSFVCADQIISNAAKMFYMTNGTFNVPIVFRGPNGCAAQVSSQHSHSVEALYANIPGLIVVSPSNASDAKGLLKSSIRNNNPVLFLESELIYNNKSEVTSSKDHLVPLGKANVSRSGSDVTVISYSRMHLICLEVGELLEKKGINLEVIDLRTIKPLDLATLIKSVKKTGRCVVVEEGHSFAGIASEITYAIQKQCFDDLNAPIERVCQMETPMPYAKNLEALSIPNKERIVDAIHLVMKF